MCFQAAARLPLCCEALGLAQTHVRVSLMNSAVSRKASSMPWMAAATTGSRSGFSVTGCSHTCVAARARGHTRVSR